MKQHISKFLTLLILFTFMLTGCSAANSLLNNTTDAPAVTQESSMETTDTSSSYPPDISTKATSELLIHFIDVGQADCILVQNQGKNVLIDAGNRADFNTIQAYLNQLDVTTINHFILTHPHEDHIGSAAKILKNFSVEKVYMTDVVFDSGVYTSLIEELSAKKIPPIYPAAGDNFSIGETAFTFLGPVSTYKDPNSMSLVARADFGSTSFLFTGDCTEEADKDMLDAGVNLEAQVLKVGHHGSRESSSYVFLKAVNPEYSVISVGIGNDYGHPTEEALSRLNDVGSTLFRTDQSGTIIAKSNGKNITWNTVGQESTQEHIDNGNGLAAETDEVVYSAGYIGNKKSLVFHEKDCSSLPAKSNQIKFSSRQEALDAGYHACQRCNP